MDIKFSDAAKTQLRSLGVVAAYLFGSHATETAGPLSDFDFAFLMKTPGHKRGDATYEALYDIVSPLCPRTSLESDVIDIVFLNDAPLELKAHVLRYGKILFDGEPLTRGHFDEQTLLSYCDFRPLLEEIDNTILASL